MKISTFYQLGFAIILGAFATRGTTEDLKPLNPEVHQFIQNYCIDCHGPEKDKGDRVFHEFAVQQGETWMFDAANVESVGILTDILDQLNLGEMPPKKTDVKQPETEKIRETVAWLTSTLTALDDASSAKSGVMRRLNTREYTNTILDLFGLENLTFDLAKDLPSDESDHGFTNIGEALSVTDMHLSEYLNAAEKIVDMAFHFGKKPETTTVRIKPEEWGYPHKEARTPWMYRLTTPGKYLDIGAGNKPLDRIGIYTYPQNFTHRGGIKQAGYYKISITAEAIRRLTHPYDPEMIPCDLTPPMQLSLHVADSMDGLAVGGATARRKLALWDLKDHEKGNFEKTVWLDKGAIPFINWDNGPGPSDYWMRDVLKKYHTDIEFRGKEGSHAWHIIGKDVVPGRLVSDVWQGPLLRVHDFAFTGPLQESFALPGQQEFLGDGMYPKDVDIKTALLKFTRKAFRRPTTEEDTRPYLNIYRHARDEMNRSGIEAMKMTFQAILVSPDFLYLKENPVDETKNLNAHEVANRLSYYLWSSMPDDQLFALADSGDLLKPEILRAQAERMIRDPKSAAFVEGFSEAWLRLDKLGSQPADSVKFQEYYRYGLEEAMRRETHEFLSHAIQKNRPVREFLNADYTFLNQSLARHYGIKNVEGSHFRKVSLPAESSRGGLLGQASVLTLSANGVDTSPVIRGIWVLENILGTPPSPAPPDVEPLDPDVRGAKTIRQKLEKHRTVETCAECHSKIDPFGFPLEFFDPIGGFRETYFKNRRWNRLKRETMTIVGSPIDGHTELPSGENFNNPLGLKNTLLKREAQFRRNITTKLATYATGRKMTFRDQATIEQIAAVEKTDRGFRDFIIDVAISELLRKRS